ncbi:hypothetical protein [Sphingorhabdus sp.]|uniref:NHL domain-containing protein n=1 Tax=Sphingorhabdus sp. TaxID=1902408 RepID=UPI003919222C
MLSGAGSRQADLSNLAPGRYSLTSSESNKRYEIIRSNNIPGGVLLANPGTSSTQFTFGTSTDGGPYFVRVKDTAGVVQQSFYVYSPDTTLRLPAGSWSVTIAQPGENGFDFVAQVGAAGELEKLNGIELVNRADWFLDSLTYGTKINDVANYTGTRLFEFEDTNPQHVIQIRDPQTRSISTYFSQNNSLSLQLGLGAFEWRVLGIAQSSIMYPALIEGLGNVQGGWTPFTHRFESARTRVGLTVPADVSNYVIRTPEGNSVVSDNYGTWIDLSSLEPGRYSLTGNGLSGFFREDLVIASEIYGGALAVRDLDGGRIKITFQDETPAPFYYVSVSKLDGSNVTAFYNYSSSIELQLEDGKYLVSIAESGSRGFSFSAYVLAGKLSFVEGIATRDKIDWYMDALVKSDPFSPISLSSGLTNFSFNAPPSGNFLIQIRDPWTKSVGTYFSQKPQLDIELGLGQFQWRAFLLPDQVNITGDVISNITAVVGGWASFERFSKPFATDYILGREPDKVFSADELTFNYPSDATRLSDGSIVVTNTYASTIERIYSDGQVERLAGGNSVGYTEQGIGREVLINRPGQILNNKNGTIYFVDSSNLVVREINLETGIVKTILGSPNNLRPTIVDGQIVGLGDIYALGRDNRGQPFITAAEATIVGDRLQSGETKVLRHSDIGRWYFWEYDRSTLTPGTQFIDILFHDDVISVLAADGGTKRYLQFNEQGLLLANLEIGGAFGAGLVKDPITGDLLIGNHTAITRLNHRTLVQSPFPFPEPFANVSYMEIDGTNLVITDSDRGRVYSYDLMARSLTAVYGQRSSTSNVIVDLESVNGSLLMLDNLTPRVLEYDQGRIRSISGNGTQARSNQSGYAVDNTLFYPNAIAAGPDGSVYFVDANHRISRIAPDQSVSPFAGLITSGYSGDGGLGINARFQSIYGLDVAADGSIYVADSFNHAIRKISADGIVSTLVGNGLASLASTAVAGQSALNVPNRVLVTDAGRIFIADSWNNRVVELTPDGRLVATAGVGKFTTYQGGGSFSGDGGDAALAGLNTPTGLAYYESDGTLFIADSFNNRIRYVDSAGNIHTLVGADRGYEFGKLLNLPNDVALVGDDLFIADTGNALVLKLVGVDRTGNDFASSLDVGKAITRSRFASRSEYVSSDDADFYNLTGYNNGLVTITAAQSGLTIKFSSGVGGYYGERILTAGQSVDIDADEHNYVIVSASEKQKYTMVFGQSSQMISNNAVVAMLESRELEVSAFDPRLSLMVQAMASFADGSGISSNRLQESDPIFDYFA